VHLYGDANGKGSSERRPGDVRDAAEEEDRRRPARAGERRGSGRGAFAAMTTGVRIRPMNELDIEGICRIDEKITGRYRPEVWEQRAAYYIRRDPDSSQVAEVDGRVVGFMLGEVRGGEFGLEEPTGWVEFFGVDPSSREKGVGRNLIEAL